MVIYVILGTMLIALVSFALTATGLFLLASSAVGGLAWFFMRLVDPEERGSNGLVKVVAVAGMGSVVGIGSGLLLGLSHVPLFDVAGVVVTAITAAALYSFRSRQGDPLCALCRRPARQGASFACPRCHDRVCARPECWNARYVRCSRCHEREIVIFPVADRWWDRRLGPRVAKGACVSCLREATEADLRECGQCHWPSCRRCWDYNNGACQRCGWMMPDTPPALAALAQRPHSQHRDRAGSGRATRATGSRHADPHNSRPSSR